MDRFIGALIKFIQDYSRNLKSNMDRFIGQYQLKSYLSHQNLKSNMDRFIDYFKLYGLRVYTFKIQYG